MAGGGSTGIQDINMKMMNLEKIRLRLQERKKSATINRAIQHQNRIRFHVENKITPSYERPAIDFIAWVDQLLPKDKAAIFKTLFQFPIKTNELTSVIFDKLSRVFDGRNPAYNYQFKNTEQRDDWEYYRQEILKEPEIWQTDGWENFKTNINSVLIVDLPKEVDSKDKLPQPYFYWLPIEDVLDYRVNSRTQNMEYIIFEQPDDHVAVLDERAYMLFKYENGEIVGEAVEDNPHDLGYCPARFFWNDPMTLDEPDIKMHPLTKVLESLDWFLFFHISKRHLDLYGAYPIYSGYESDCDYENVVSGESCDGGFLLNGEGEYMMGLDGTMQKCPKCGDKRIVGVGSFVEVPIPVDGEPDLRNPVQLLGIDTQSLKYHVDEYNRLREGILASVVGKDEGALDVEALNETQVGANFENKGTILNRIKKGFEEAQDFVDETVCRLRYGKTFISANINYGTEFYVVDPLVLRKQYKMAKDNGASEAELDTLQQQLIETEYRHNQTQLQRMIILAELEPFRHFTRQEVLGMHQKQLISEKDFIIKINFTTFVNRFERENINLIDFGVERPFYEKINIIQQKFNDYAEEYIKQLPVRRSDEGDVPGGGDRAPRVSREDRD